LSVYFGSLCVQVCNTKNASDPGHALEIITNRGVLSLVPDTACAEWEAMLHVLGPLEVRLFVSPTHRTRRVSLTVTRCCRVVQIPDKGVLYKGCLYKKGRINRSWKLRFCVLTLDGERVQVLPLPGSLLACV
jgi:hypothetical protein